MDKLNENFGTRRVLEQAVVDAAMNLAGATLAHSFSIPVANTTPQLFVSLCEKPSIMSKTTPEEARQLATKHLGEFWSGRQMVQLAALIDEAVANAPLRGVDAEPVWPNPAISTPFLSELKRVNQGDYYSAEQVHALINAYNNLYRATHPAPSQPAALVELPVVEDWGIDTSTGRAVLVHRNCSVIEDEQARYVLNLIAIAAGRDAS